MANALNLKHLTIYHYFITFSLLVKENVFNHSEEELLIERIFADPLENTLLN